MRDREGLDKEKPWTPQEEWILVCQHKEHGNSWTQIAECLDGRSESGTKNKWYSTKRAKPKVEPLSPSFRFSSRVGGALWAGSRNRPGRTEAFSTSGLPSEGEAFWGGGEPVGGHHRAPCARVHGTDTGRAWRNPRPTAVSLRQYLLKVDFPSAVSVGRGFQAPSSQ